MASSYPIGLLTPDEALHFNAGIERLFTTGGDVYTQWNRDLGDWMAVWSDLLNETPSGNDTIVLIVINDTMVPLVLDADPTLYHGWYMGGPPKQGMPARETIPPSVEGMPTVGYFRFERPTGSGAGIEGAIAFSAQSPDLPNGITLGFESGGASSWALQCAVVQGESATSVSDNLGNSKYGTSSTVESDTTNPDGSTTKLAVYANIQAAASQYTNQEGDRVAFCTYFMAVYVQCTHSN